MKRWWLALPLAAVIGCAAGRTTPATSNDAAAGTPPASLLGDFTDDYGGRFSITAGEWWQQPRNRYRVVRWNVAEQYLIAQNGADNPTAPGRWTRIDWMTLEGMPPWRWAFCLSAYDAPSAAAAESSSVAKRATPRTGCNGYPFSRMRAVNSAP